MGSKAISIKIDDPRIQEMLNQCEPGTISKFIKESMINAESRKKDIEFLMDFFQQRKALIQHTITDVERIRFKHIVEDLSHE